MTTNYQAETQSRGSRAVNRAAFYICFAALSACATTGDSSLQSGFARERSALTCFEGSTSEQSCGGTNLTVYLRGNLVRHLDWTVEMSTRWIRREYYFDGSSPRLVVETIHAKYDAYGEPLATPRLLSIEHYRPDAPQPDAHQKELLDHAQFLIDDFKRHREEFTSTRPVTHP